MSQTKKLLGQTAIYGLSSILGRFAYFLLTPLHTRLLNPEAYGVNTDIYTLIGIFTVVLTLGLETAYFRFSGKVATEEKAVFQTAQSWVFGALILFLGLSLLFQNTLLNAMQYAAQPHYLWLLLGILSTELIIAIPFARLRMQNKALRFALTRLSGIFLNVLLNLYFFLLGPYFSKKGIHLPFISEEPLVEHIFIANVCSGLLMILLLTPVLRDWRLYFPKVLSKKILFYGLPLMLAGLAGIINELIDRQLIKYLVDMAQLGIYGGIIKLAVFMGLLIQAYRYAVEPFFFGSAENKNAPQTIAAVMEVMVLFLVLVMTGLAAGIDVIQLFIGEAFREGVDILPWLFGAQLFLGIMMHLSMWYKLSDQTRYGIYLSLIGAVLTVGGNLLLLPILGLKGAAITAFAVHVVVAVVSYIWGQRHYFVPYRVGKILGIIIPGLILSFFFVLNSYSIWIKGGIWLIFAVILLYIDKEKLKRLRADKRPKTV